MIKIKQLVEQKDSKHAAGIAYIVGDELLCVKSISGRWGIPKGHRHIDESPEDGAHRAVSYTHLTLPTIYSV